MYENIIVSSWTLILKSLLLEVISVSENVLHMNIFLKRKCPYESFLLMISIAIILGLSLSWSFGSWINNYLCNQCLSPLKLWVRIPFMTRCTRYNIMWWSLSVTCNRSVVFSTNKTDHHNITETLLKVALNTIKQTNQIYQKIHSINIQ